MIKTLNSILLILCGSILFGGTAIADNMTNTSQQPITTARFSGETKSETSKTIAEYSNQRKVDQVIISTGKGLPDAFSASVSADQKKTDALSRYFSVKVTPPVKNRPFINALSHVETPTYDRSNQAVHPSVIDFKTEYGIEAWGDFRYWMALTPYPNFNSAFENPCILVSKDGLNWINPPSIKNPLATKPRESLRDHYNSDPELIYDPDQNTLLLYWRECKENAFEKIWLIEISSDFKQSDNILCLEKAWDYKKTGLVLSPTVWRKNAKEWYMWTTDGRVGIQLSTSIDGRNWSSGKPCSAPWVTWNDGYIPWHISAKPNYLEESIDFLIAGWPIKGTLKDSQLLYATAPMSHPRELSMPLMEPLLRPGAGDQWDNGYIYQSSFVRESGGSPKFRIWYSACSKKNAWHIGYTEGTLTNIP